MAQTKPKVFQLSPSRLCSLWWNCAYFEFSSSRFNGVFVRILDTIVWQGHCLAFLSCLGLCSHTKSWLHLSFCGLDPTYLGTTWSKIRPVDLLLHRQYVPLCNMPAFLLLLFSCTAIWKHVCRNVQVGNSIELDKVGHQFKTCLGAGESFSSVLELNQCCQTPWDGVQQPFFVTKCDKGTKSL